MWGDGSILASPHSFPIACMVPAAWCCSIVILIIPFIHSKTIPQPTILFVLTDRLKLLSSVESSGGKTLGWWLWKSSQMPEDTFFFLVLARSYYIQICPRTFSIWNPPKTLRGRSVSRGRVSLVFPTLWLPFPKVLHFPTRHISQILFLKSLGSSNEKRCWFTLSEMSFQFFATLHGEYL